MKPSQLRTLADSRWQLAGWLLAAAFPVLALVVGKAASGIYALFFLAGLWLLVTRRFERPDPAVRWILLAFGLYFLIGALSFAFGEQTRLGEKLLGRDIRFLGAIPVFFALARLAFPERIARVAFIFGGFVTGVFALFEVALAADWSHRVHGAAISIVFGHLSVMLFALNLALAVFERRGRSIAALAAAFALLAVVLSGTRGALLSVLAVTLVAMALALWRRSSQGRGQRIATAGAAALVIVALAVAWLFPRLQEGWQEYRAYLSAPDIVAQPRGCIGEHEALRRFLAGSHGHGVKASIRKNGGAAKGCEAEFAIHLRNPSARTGLWIGPYRNVPAGADGELVVRGQARLQFHGSESVTVDSPGFVRLALPPLPDAERSELLVRIPPHRSAWLVPVETHPAEYAFTIAESSIGNRLMMWSLALRRAELAPLGRGPGTWPLIAGEEAAAARVPWKLAAYDHAHNDYLSVMLERGWLGLLALVAVLVAPLRSGLQRGGTRWRQHGLVLIATAASVSALTETVFNHSIGITYYCFLVLLLVTAQRTPPCVQA